MDIKEFEKILELSIKNKVKNINVSEDMFDKIKLESERRTMKSLFIPKYIIIGVILALTSVTAYSAALVTSVKSSSVSVEEEIYTQEEMEKFLDVKPKYIEKFSNGFELYKIVPLYKEVEGNQNGKSVSLNYKNLNNGGNFNLIISKAKDSDEQIENELNFSYSVGKEFNILDNDDLIISYIENDDSPYSISFKYYDDLVIGESEEITINNTVWKQDGIRYCLSYNKETLSENDVMNIVNELKNL